MAWTTVGGKKKWEKQTLEIVSEEEVLKVARSLLKT